MQTVIVTGARGFLGRACCASFTANGFEVRALVRDPEAARDLAPIARGGIYAADLPKTIDDRAFRGAVRALVHCAYATTAQSRVAAKETNIAGTREILRLAAAGQIDQLIFISSLAAHPNAVSEYGRTKLALEKLFDTPASTVIKPGTIIGNGGVFRRTREMVRRLPVVPILYGDRLLQTIYIDDVCTGILNCVQHHVSGRLVLAHPQAVKMREFYSAIALADGVRAKFISFPGDFALAAVILAERLGMRAPISSDNLLGLKHLRIMDPAPSLARLALHPLSFLESLAAAKGPRAARNA